MFNFSCYADCSVALFGIGVYDSVRDDSLWKNGSEILSWAGLAK